MVLLNCKCGSQCRVVEEAIPTGLVSHCVMSWWPETEALHRDKTLLVSLQNVVLHSPIKHLLKFVTSFHTLAIL